MMAGRSPRAKMFRGAQDRLLEIGVLE